MASSNFNDQNGIFKNILKDFYFLHHKFLFEFLFYFLKISRLKKKIISVQATKGIQPLHMICDYTNVGWFFGTMDK